MSNQTTMNELDDAFKKSRERARKEASKVKENKNTKS